MRSYLWYFCLASVVACSLCFSGEVKAALVAHWELDEIDPNEPNHGTKPPGFTGATPDSVGSIPLDIISDAGSVTLGASAPAVGTGSSFSVEDAPGTRRIRTRHGTYYPELWTPSFTVALWSKSDVDSLDPNDSVRTALFGTRTVPTPAAAEGFVLYRRTQIGYEARLGAAIGQPLESIDTPVPPVAGAWEHLTLSFEAETNLGDIGFGPTWEGTASIYFNGVLMAQGVRNYTAPSLSHSPAQRNFYLGSTSSSFLYDGLLDDVRFYDHALDPNEVAALAMFTPAAGDFDADGDVDSDDLALLEEGYGMVGDALWGDGDTDADGDVDGLDFLTWQLNYTGSNPLSVVQSVPEPTTIGLCVLLIAISLPARR